MGTVPSPPLPAEMTTSPCHKSDFCVLLLLEGCSRVPVDAYER